jgi:hypothetical protein
LIERVSESLQVTATDVLVPHHDRDDERVDARRRLAVLLLD